MKKNLSIAASLCALFCAGCATDNTWRADGFGVTLSTTSISVVYGEINKIPPGGYFRHTRSIDLRPFWKRWLCDPGTNCIAESTVVLDARRVRGEADGGASMETPEKQQKNLLPIDPDIYIMPDSEIPCFTNNVMLISRLVNRHSDRIAPL